MTRGYGGHVHRPKVKCEDCYYYEPFRCTLTGHYMNPKLRRYCHTFKPKPSVDLEAWIGAGLNEQQK